MKPIVESPSRFPESNVSDSGFEASTARSGASIESLEADTVSSESSSHDNVNGGAAAASHVGSDSLTASNNAINTQQQQQQLTWIESQRAAVLQREDRKFTDAKKELRAAIADIRTHLKIFMEKNRVLQVRSIFISNLSNLSKLSI